MCGRVRLSSDVSEIKLVFSIPPHRPSPNIARSWNVAPTDPVPVVHYDTKAGERSLDVMRWGLVPFWAKDIKVGFSNINAKAEGIEGKPAFREAFQRWRCLVPVDNFYEWADRNRPPQVTSELRLRMVLASPSTLSPLSVAYGSPLSAGLGAPRRKKPRINASPRRTSTRSWRRDLTLC
jgi:putative SOS response-associated peptidase YedK